MNMLTNELMKRVAQGAREIQKKVDDITEDIPEKVSALSSSNRVEVCSLSAGDKIWYRRRGETYIHTSYVQKNRGRVLAVAAQRGVGDALWNWLDPREIEVLDVERDPKKEKDCGE
jgi:hypothetical protein